MYETFFALRERPFTATPRAERYFPAASIETARRTLERCVDRAEGIAMLIGPPGSGKSVVGHLLVKRFQPTLPAAFLQHGKFKNRKALLQAILFELRLPYRDMDEGELRLALQEFLRTTERCANGLLLIVDEAQSLTSAQLEELHMLSLIVVAGKPSVRIVLLGGPGLEEKLTNPRLDAFSQRIVARCYLESLTVEETQAYVRSQLQGAGAAQNLFSSEAITSLHNATDGVPRLINQVCDHALVLAFAGGRKRLDARVVEEAWADLQQLPSPWTDGRRKVEGDAAVAAPTIIEFGRLGDDDATIEIEEEPLAERPAIHAWYGDLEQDEPNETLTTLEHHLDELQSTYRPTVAAATVTHADPFAETFAEEEVVIDRFASLGDVSFRAEQMVTTPLSAELSRMLQPYDRGEQRAKMSFVEAPVQDAPAAVVTVEAEVATSDPVSPEEPEMIVIEEGPEEPAPVVHPIAKRQEYRQLFAKLRRG